MAATFRPGMYVGGDHGTASEPYWGFLDNAEVWLTGTVSFAPGFFAMQYAGPFAYAANYEFWGPGGSVRNMLARAYTWCTAQANRRVILRCAPGFYGANAAPAGIPVGQAAYDAVANGQYTSTINDMVDALYNAGAHPGLLPYAIMDPWWESGAWWFEWAASNLSGNTSVVPAGDWRSSVFNAYRKMIGDAKAKETALTGGAPVLQWGFGYAGDSTSLLGLNTITGGPTGEGIYPGNTYIDWITPDIYSPGSAQQFQGSFSQIRTFALAHGKPIVIPEFGWLRTQTTEAADLAFLQGFHDEVVAQPSWKGFVHFNTSAPDGDSQIYNPFSPTTVTALASAKPNALAYFKSTFGQPLNQPGAATSQLSNVTWTQIGTNTVRVAGNATSDILSVIVYTDNTHVTALGQVAPASGAFSVDIPNVAVGGPYAWDVGGRNAVGTGGTIVATFGLSVTVTAAAALTLVAPSTSGTTRTIPFTVTGAATNVTAYEPPYVKTAGTNDVAPVAGAGTIVATGLTNGSHTITVYAWSGTGPGDPNATVIATATDTFTISTQPTADDFNATALNGTLWTVSKPTGDPSSATLSSGQLVLAIPQVDVTDNTTRANNASISVGSTFAGGYTLIGSGGAALAANAIHNTNTAAVDTVERVEQDLSTPDMMVEVNLALITISGVTTVAYGACARMGTGATPSYYLAFVNIHAGPLWDVYLYKIITGTPTLLADTTGSGHVSAPVVGGASSKLRLEVVGNKITTFLNDAVVIPTVTDSAVTTGNFGGLFMNRGSGSVDISISNPRVASYYHQNYVTDRSVGVEQTVANGDYPAQEVKFHVPSLSVSGVGLQYRNSGTGDRMLAYVYIDNTGPHVAITSVTGGVATNYPTQVPVFPLADALLQVSRVGNNWSFWTAASDGSNRISHGQVAFTMTVDRIKVFAINQPAA